MRDTCKGLVDYVAITYRSAVEIGVGHFPDVAIALANRGVRIFATDIKPFKYRGLKVIVDDVTDPDLSLYAGVNLIYSLRPPAELVPYMNRLARKVSVDLIFKPLTSEHPGGQLARHGSSTFFLREFS